MDFVNVVVRSLLESDVELRRLERKLTLSKDKDIALQYLRLLQRKWGSVENWVEARWKEDRLKLKALFDKHKDYQLVRNLRKARHTDDDGYYMSWSLQRKPGLTYIFTAIDLLIYYPDARTIANGITKETVSIQTRLNWLKNSRMYPAAKQNIQTLVTLTVDRLTDLFKAQGKHVKVTHL